MPADPDPVYDALNTVLHHQDGSMLGRFVLVGESLEADGTRTTWLSCPDGQAGWETLGLLEFARTAELGHG